MRRRSITRREFIRCGLLAAGALALPGIAPFALAGRRAPSERIRLAMLGVGSRGSAVMREFARHDDVQFLAVCDPFRDRREAAQHFLEGKQGPGVVKTYTNYRDVMARDDIDAVVCCSCDHWHIPLAVAAARAGKDMYVEKPLGRSIAWAKVLRQEVKRRGNVFQYGTQQRSGRQFRRVVELVRNGYLGEIERIDAWCIDGTRAQEWFDPASTVPEPVPEGLDYDLWLGPAPWKPYNHWRVHREGSFHTYDYSLGFVAGWGAHPLDIAQWGLDADGTSPIHYEGKAKIPKTGGLYSTIYDWDFRLKYASGVQMHFMSHRPAESVVKAYRKRWSDHGTTFVGKEGWISVDRGGVEASNPKLLKVELGSSDSRLPVSQGHDRNFLDAVRSREATLNPLESAIRSDTISHLCDLAARTGRAIRWDPKTEHVVGDEEADRMLERPMRSPYEI